MGAMTTAVTTAVSNMSAASGVISVGSAYISA